MNLIITAGNEKFFKKLRLFAYSLREVAKFKGEVVLVDNIIKKGKYLSRTSFSPASLKFFRQYKIKVVPFHKLLQRHRVEREMFDCISSAHPCYPLKQIATTLLTKEYMGKAEKVCVVDADVWFQKPIDKLFDQFDEDHVFMTAERLRLESNAVIDIWLDHTDVSDLSSAKLFRDTMAASKNLNAGFMGGSLLAIHKFNLLAWIIGTGRLLKYHSDQPLFNILKAFFNYPLKELPWKWVLHVWDAHPRHLTYSKKSGIVRYHGVVPHAVHFNAESFYKIVSPHIKNAADVID